MLIGQLSLIDLQEQITFIKDKISFLMGKTDSFYACTYFKKTAKFSAEKEWIFLKNAHEIYLYNIEDHHISHGKLIRKKKPV